MVTSPQHDTRTYDPVRQALPNRRINKEALTTLEGVSALFSALVISIRETSEASLPVSVILALVTQVKNLRLRRALWTGVGSAGATGTVVDVT